MKRLRGFEFVTEHKKHSEEVEIRRPKRGTKRSAGYDFYSPIACEIPVGGKLLIWTDIKAYMQDDEFLFLDIRSSSGIKKDLMLANTIGVIDSDYYNNVDNEGNIGICLRNLGEEDIKIERNEKIAQGIFVPYLLADEDSTDNERVGGIGSTDK